MAIYPITGECFPVAKADEDELCATTKNGRDFDFFYTPSNEDRELFGVSYFNKTPKPNTLERTALEAWNQFWLMPGIRVRLEITARSDQKKRLHPGNNEPYYAVERQVDAPSEIRRTVKPASFETQAHRSAGRAGLVQMY